MKALVYEAPRVMRLRDLDVPQPGPGEARIRIAYSGICGSELSGFLGQNSLRQPPLVFGHELSGHIDDLGEAAGDWSLGTAVTVNPLISCGRCRYCVTGRHQLCPQRRLLGAAVPGSNAEYLTVPLGSLEAVPDGLDLRNAAMAEPAACAVHAVTASHAGPKDTALVVGAGPIGLFLIQVLTAHGVSRTLVSDLNQERLRTAQKLGAEPVSPADGELAAAVLAATEGNGVTLAFDAAGTPGTRLACLQATSPGGSVMLTGLHTDATELPINTVVRSEITMRGVFAYTPQAFRTALGWLAQGRLGLRDGVVETALEDGPDWYQRLVDGDPASKVLLRPTGTATEAGTPQDGGRA